MSDKKKSFVLYLDQQDLFNKLPDEIAGKLIKHIFSYVNCEDPQTDDLLLDIAFSPIKQSLKRDLNKWKAQIQQRSEAGKRSAEKRANEKQRKATSVESRSTKSTDSVSVSVSVSGSVSDSNKYIDHFESFWLGYPKKVSKPQALKAFKKVYKDLKLTDESAIEFIEMIHTDCMNRFVNTEKQFIPNASTYLNNDRWNDEY